MDTTAAYAVRSLALRWARSLGRFHRGVAPAAPVAPADRAGRRAWRLLVVVALVGAVVGWRDLPAVQAVPGALTAPPAPVTAHPATNPDGVFHPITPCRVFDTRAVGGRFAPGQTRTYDVAGPTSRTAKGAGPDRCGIPEWALAVTGTLTATGASASGFVRTWPVGKSEPSATVLNYAKGVSTGTGAVFRLAQVSGTSLAVKSYGGPTHLILDVTGYYAEQIHATVHEQGAYSGSRHVVGFSLEDTGHYLVTLDRDVTGCSAFAHTGVHNSFARVLIEEPNRLRIYVFSLQSGRWVSAGGHAHFLVTC